MNVLQVVNNDLSPKWRPFDVKMSRLCGGNPNVTIKVRFLLFYFIVNNLIVAPTVPRIL